MSGSAIQAPDGGLLRKRATRQRRGDLTKRTILSAAALEFAAKGFEGASVRGIARSIGQEAPLVKYHFGDKLGLWSAVIDDVVLPVHARIVEMLEHRADRPAAEQLCNVIDAVARHAAGDPIFVGLITDSAPEGSEVGKVYNLKIRANEIMTIRLIEEAQTDGDFIPGNPNMLFQHMLGTIFRLFSHGADLLKSTGGKLSDREFVDEHVKLCIAQFMPGAFLAEDGTWTAPDRHLADRRRNLLSGESPKRLSSQPSERPTIFFLLTNVATLMRRSLDEELTALSLTQAQMIALISMASEPKLSSARLARLLDVTPQTVTLLVKATEAKGLITRKAHPVAGRTLQIEITEAGVRVLESLRQITTTAESNLLEGLTFEERAGLHHLLKDILGRHRPEALMHGASLFRKHL